MMTCYVIRQIGTPLYYAGDGRWTHELPQAARFEFQTSAELYATLMHGWPLSHYRVEWVVVPPRDQPRLEQEYAAYLEGPFDPRD